MSRIIEITSRHHWHKNTRLELEVCDTPEAGPRLVSRKWYASGEEIVPGDDAEWFIRELDNLYTLFGTIQGLEIKGGTFDEVYDMIYAIETPKNVRFIALSTCGCNMGHCDAIRGYGIIEYKTIGDIIMNWGYETDTDVMSRPYYEHPDSVFFYIQIEKGSFKMYEGHQHENPKTVDLDNNYTYISLSYGR